MGDEYVLRFKDFHNSEDVEYAILSHAWGEEEILFADVTDCVAHSKKGFDKVIGAMHQAREDELEYIWIDTCCIDKTSSAELSEAINSMYLWYKDAVICYAYLTDIAFHRTRFHADITSSRWFTRGWTLQELLAPRYLKFFSQEWQYLGTKNDYSKAIYQRTKIEVEFLLGTRQLGTASIAKRMSWSARRKTTRPEDLAYCMMGIFSVNMPLLYGEGGQKAFLRLQEEIMRDSDDESLFAWKDPGIHQDTLHGLLADHPSAFDFKEASSIVSYTKREYESGHGWNSTNKGLNIELYLRLDQNLQTQYHTELHVAALNCPDPREEQSGYIGIHLIPHDHRSNPNFSTIRRFSRIHCNQLFFVEKDDRGYAQSMIITSRVEHHDATTNIVPSHQFRLRNASLGRPAEYYTVEAYLAYGHSMVQMLRKPTGSRVVSAFTTNKIGSKVEVPNLEVPDVEIIRRPRTLAGAYLMTFEQDRRHIAIMVGTIDPFSVGFDARYMDTLETFDAMAEYFDPVPIPVTSLPNRPRPSWVKESGIELAMHKIQVTAIARTMPLVKVYNLQLRIVKGSPGAFPEFPDEWGSSDGSDLAMIKLYEGC